MAVAVAAFWTVIPVIRAASIVISAIVGRAVVHNTRLYAHRGRSVVHRWVRVYDGWRRHVHRGRVDRIRKDDAGYANHDIDTRHGGAGK